MTFNSLSYFMFLPVVYLAFYFTPDRFRWLVLLSASYGFYATFKAPQLLFVLALVTAISFRCGVKLGETMDTGRRKRIFCLGAVGCILILAVEKYLPHLLTSAVADAQNARLLISIGVSYFSFQAISYLADVYLNIQEPERHLGYHALSLAFFPKLLQGPIERAGDLLPQLRKKYEFDYDAMRFGMLLFCRGLFKKVVVAERLALYVNAVYNDVQSYTGLPLLIATYAYALQIYFDFSGYTDMARGTARLFGINLTENFNSPYMATSIADFWRRWHISFSRWILDYIFKPLQMAWRYQGKAGTVAALLITFLVSGIWHGASWGFIVWGGLHGIYLASSTLYRPYQKSLYKWLGVEKRRWLKGWQVFVTFNLISLAWVFFRAGSLGDAWYVVNNLLDLSGSYTVAHRLGAADYLRSNILMGLKLSNFITVAAVLSISYLVYKNRDFPLFEKPVWFRWSFYYLAAFTIVSFQVPAKQFIYFQF